MTTFLTDTSAWHRSGHPAFRDEWLDAVAGDRVAVCDTVRLEVLYSARNADQYAQWDRDLDQFRQAPSDGTTFRRAREVQRLLSRRGGLHHRSVRLADLLIAASAEAAGYTMWHYDEDFDRVADITGQPTLWVAPRGSL